MINVSICIPTYNQPKSLKRLLDSIKIQSYKNFEIVITDDSTNEEVKRVIDKHILKNKIKYYKNKINLGSPENWNESISKASGNLIKIMHHDDFFTRENSLSLFVKMMDENKSINFGFSSTLIMNLSLNKKRIHRPILTELDDLKRNPEVLFDRNFIGAPSCAIFKKNNIFFDKNLKWLVDVDFYIRLLDKNKKFIFINTPLVCTVDGDKNQVTSSCVNNQEIEVNEYIKLFNKLNIQRNMVLKKFEYLAMKYKLNKITNFGEYKNLDEKHKNLLDNIFADLKKYYNLRLIRYGFKEYIIMKKISYLGRELAITCSNLLE